MRKIYSLVLMAAMLLLGANAWATPHQVGTYADLQTTLTNAVNGDVIELTADIAYPTNGTGLINITKSITLDGKGHKLSGYGTANISVSGTENWPVTLAVNYQGSASAALDVTIQNLHVSNEATGSRSYGLMAFEGVDKLTLSNDSVYLGKSTASYKQGICFSGTDATPIELKIEDSFIGTGSGYGYPAYILKPINATFKNTEFSGYCSLYFKYRATGAYGDVVGSRGSVVNAQNCAFNAPNIHSGKDNDFAVFPMEDDGIDLTIENCSFNADHFGDQPQAVISLQYNKRTSGFQPIKVKFKGDNTHVYNVAATNFAWNSMATGYYAQVTQTDERKGVNVGLQLTIEGGTYDIDPRLIKYSTYGENDWDHPIKDINHAEHPYTGEWTYASIDLSTYEVKEVLQGTKTVYRVVKSVAKNGSGDPLYNLNDNVESQGAGQNENTAFELSSGTPMTLGQATTEAGYVQVKDNGSGYGTTVTVGTDTQDQTLIINNGLDVQGSSKVDVQAGSALVIGDGGIVTENAGNIVLNADANDGCASLLLDPTVTVNQTPALTVKMKAEQVGLYESEYYWHRFAMPVDGISDLPKTPSVATAIYGWNYGTQDWYALSSLNELVPFAGYALTVNDDRQDVTYTFQGNLTGNINTNLAFSHQGYNFFGNSYTGYIKVSYLATEIIGNADLDASIWMWDPTNQTYTSVPLQALKEAEVGGYETMYANWKREIAPMQTFILRLPNTTSANAEIDYATTIWSNPRYTGSATPAPARVTEIEGTIVRMSVVDANGNSDEMLFMEKDSYSDAYDRGYDATKYMNSNKMNMYTILNGEKLSAVATDNLNGMSFDIETQGAINYTLTFDAVLGEAKYAVRDIVTGATIAMNQGNTYTFTAQPNSTVAGRFVIVPIQNMPTDVETVEATSNVRGIYTITGQYVGEDFESLPAGVYVVDGVKIVK